MAWQPTDVRGWGAGLGAGVPPLGSTNVDIAAIRYCKMHRVFAQVLFRILAASDRSGSHAVCGALNRSMVRQACWRVLLDS